MTDNTDGPTGQDRSEPQGWEAIRAAENWLRRDYHVHRNALLDLQDNGEPYDAAALDCIETELARLDTIRIAIERRDCGNAQLDAYSERIAALEAEIDSLLADD